MDTGKDSDVGRGSDERKISEESSGQKEEEQKSQQSPQGVVWFATDMCTPADGEQAEKPAEGSEKHRVRRRRSTIRQLLSEGVSAFPKVETIDEENVIVLAPSEKVKHLLNVNCKNLQKSIPCQMFTELKMLTSRGASGTLEWREIARWVKYEETVEEGGNRWSKPHVATLTLHSLFELRSCFLKGVVLFEVIGSNVEQIIDVIMAKWVEEYALSDEVAKEVRSALLSRHRHQYEGNRSTKDGMSSGHSFMRGVRSIADIGRTFSHARACGMTESTGGAHQLLSVPDNSVGHSKSGSGIAALSGQVSPTAKGANASGQKNNDHHAEGNYHLFKKLARDAEAANVLVGEVKSLKCRLSVFVRLERAHNYEHLTEVPVPTRFMFILIGPEGSNAKYKEVGRAMSTLMSDEVFSEVAYQARERQNLLDGIDEFLEQVMVLPPAEWDPAIRIEPPASVPSQEGRKKPPPKTEDGETVKDVIEKLPDDKDALKKTGRIFGGLINDVKRKIKWYPSDIKDGFNLQCLAAFLFMYFAMLAPIVTFGGLLEEATDRNLAAIENLLSGAICGILYSLFSGQPLTMIGSTGPVLIFEKLVYDGCRSLGIDFLGTRFWINMWSAAILLIIVAYDLSRLVSYITRFTEECFAALISFIFIYESIVKLASIFSHRHVITWSPGVAPINQTCTCVNGSEVNYESLAMKFSRRGENVDKWLKTDVDNRSFIDWANIPLDYCSAAKGQLQGTACYQMLDVFLASFVLLFGTFALAMVLKHARNSSYFPSRVRAFISDFAVIISIVTMIMLDAAMGLNTPKLYVPENFKPTREGRAWLVQPFVESAFWWVPVATCLPAVLLCILLFMDHQITVVIVNRKENKLKKGCGYHLDLFMIAMVCIITGMLGLPIFVAATVMSVSHVNALRQLSECQAPGEKPKFIGVHEQRLTGLFVFLFIGLSVLMTSVLKHIPMPVLYGVFLYMGISSLSGVQMVDRLLLLLMPMKYQPDSFYLRHVPIRRVHLFTLCQVTCFIFLCVIKEIRVTSMGFPVLLVFLVAIRKLLECIFTNKELKYLDDEMPDIFLRIKEDSKMKRQTEEEQRAEEKQKKTEVANASTTLMTVSENEDVQIPLASGLVMSIPLKSLNRTLSEERELNVSEEVARTGLWKHIASSVDVTKTKDVNGKKGEKWNAMGENVFVEEKEDDTEAITISFDRDTKSDVESKPLLLNESNGSNPV